MSFFLSIPCSFHFFFFNWFILYQSVSYCCARFRKQTVLQVANDMMERNIVIDTLTHAHRHTGTHTHTHTHTHTQSLSHSHTHTNTHTHTHPPIVLHTKTFPHIDLHTCIHAMMLVKVLLPASLLVGICRAVAPKVP